MQQPNQPNPYAPPTTAIGFVPERAQRYEFDVEVLESDVHRATRALGNFLLAFALACGMAWFSLKFIFVTPRQGTLLFFVPMSLCTLFFLIRTTWMNIGPGAGRVRVRFTPLILGHTHGTITNSEIRMNTEKITYVNPLRSCCYAEILADTLVFSFDQQRSMLHILPKRAFAAGCFEQAAELLKRTAIVANVSPASGVIDQRLLQADQFFQIEMPSGIAFCGPLTTRDVLNSPLRSQAAKGKRQLLAVIACSNLLLLGSSVLFFIKLIPVAGAALLAVSVYLNYMLLKTYRANLKWANSPDQILAHLRGVLNDESLYVTSPAGACIYRWDVFIEAIIQEELITLALPGKLGQRVLLTPQQFASDWSAAQELVRTKGHLFPIIDR